jgi:hypothetical protein
MVNILQTSDMMAGGLEIRRGMKMLIDATIAEGEIMKE